MLTRSRITNIQTDMIIITLFVAFIVGLLISLLIAGKSQMLKSVQIFVLGTALFGFFKLLLLANGLFDANTVDNLRTVVRWGSLITQIFMGLSLGIVMFNLNSKKNETYSELLDLTISGQSILIALSFIFFAIGKLEHPYEMEAFFEQSGLVPWLNYLIIALELLGSIGLLLHRFCDTGIWASAGLLAIMIGAVSIHALNDDAIQDSFDAFVQIFHLTILVILYWLNRKGTSINN